MIFNAYTCALHTCNSVDPCLDALLYPQTGAELVVDRLAQELGVDMHVGEKTGGLPLGARQSHEWVRHVIALLDVAVGQLHREQAAHGALIEATSLLRRQVDPQTTDEGAGDRKERLLAWQARKVLEHIDRHVTNRVLVADLCALVQRSEAHFSRSFKHTFGHSPHAFVIRRRVELAAQHMLQTDTTLSEIALQCGFVDQPHLCKHFRQLTGETPAAWRRARRAQGAEMEWAGGPGAGALAVV
jgi:AraC family transcriptional regulator